MADERFERRLTQESGATRREIAAVRQEIAAVRQEVDSVRQELRHETSAIRREMSEGFAQVHQKIADARADVIKWSFLFWTGQSLTTAGILLAILRSH